MLQVSQLPSLSEDLLHLLRESAQPNRDFRQTSNVRNRPINAHAPMSEITSAWWRQSRQRTRAEHNRGERHCEGEDGDERYGRNRP
jgi:CRISPR/Cas system endoribonuclease Cas6 (RAMP superfamily)